MQQPAVSVVIATRDRPVLLRRAVGSVLNQRGVSPIEIIVVVDGPAQESLVDVEPGPHDLQCVRNTGKPGLAGARNEGIMRASADLVAFCDDDDEWLPGKLAAQIESLKDPSVVLGATAIEIRSEGGSHVRTAPAEVGLADLLKDRITELHPSSFLIRRSALMGELGLVDEEIPASYGEDYDLLLRAAKVGRIVALPQPLTVVHWDRASYFTQKWRGIADGLSYLLDKHPEFGSSRSGSARIEGQIAFAHGAVGDKAHARSWASKAIGHDPLQPRAYLALMVGLGLVSANWVVNTLNRHGRGV
ncbi:MAG: glycosyltransferase family 2 protein [Galactobacter sp.]|uniref:glycosyltransferase family 2 protein n=1 Tax=Galactobacter sp. TaxID=2676125 RepID=UPI0025C554D2|nr:glycosyltransferase family 2 protein [Galactobacter sp.]